MKRKVANAEQAGHDPDLKQDDVRTRIKELATRLLVTRGVKAMSFGEIAEKISTTRANIHYHFKNKGSLVEEVIIDYVDIALSQLSDIWTGADVTFRDRLQMTCQFNRSRYLRYNSAHDYGHPWSLITRMRADRESLTRRAKKPLSKFVVELRKLIRRGIEQAIVSGELSPSTPTLEVEIQIANLINSVGAILEDSGEGFDSIGELYESFILILYDAYGT